MYSPVESGFGCCMPVVVVEEGEKRWIWLWVFAALVAFFPR